LLDAGCKSSEETNLPFNWVVYPNPVNHELYIQGAEPEDSWQMQLLSPDGKIWQVPAQHISDGLFVMDMQQLPSGMYILKIKSIISEFSQKIIKVD